MPRAKPRQSVSAAPRERLPDPLVEEQPALVARLSAMDRAQLLALVQALVARQPNLVELIEEQLTLDDVAAAPSPSARRSPTRARRTTAPATKAIRRQVRSLLRSTDYLGEVAYGVLELTEQAHPHLEVGDGNSALAILEAVTEEFVTGWTDLDDSDGDADGLFSDLGALWAEAILTADLSPPERQTWRSVWPTGRAKPRLGYRPHGLRSRAGCRSARLGRARAAADAACGGCFVHKRDRRGSTPISPVRDSTFWSVRGASRRRCTWPTPRGRSIGTCRCWCAWTA